MKVLVFKAVVLVVILVFMLMLLPKQSDAQAIPDQIDPCILARIIAAWVCDNLPPRHCAIANAIANWICG